MVTRTISVALALALVAGCDAPDEPTDRAALTPTGVLARASLDLRGRRPSADELAAIEADPSRLDDMIDGFVDDPAFAGRVADMFAGGWRTRIDTYSLAEDLYDEATTARLSAAIGEEPLSLLAFIAENDLPYTHLVRATETFVDPALLEIWPLVDVPDDGTALPDGVVRARYSDGRPLAGVLTQNAVFWRHPSTLENANRGRTNALSQALLCQSYLDRPIDFPTDLDLTDSESIRNAIASNGACQGCHSTMDPFASYFWGFMYAESDVPMPGYAVELERAWQVYTGAQPAFFGTPGDRVVDLADEIAADERFIGCAVRRVYEGMLGRPATFDDEGALAEHREAFLAGGLTLRALVRSVLRDPSYRGSEWTPRFGGTPEPVVRKVSPVDVMATSIADLSGYALTHDGRSATRLDSSLRAIAGGSDRGDPTEVATGAMLVLRRLAQAGAMHAIDATLDGEDGGGTLAPLLADIDLDAPPEPEQLAGLARVARSHVLDADDPEVVALVGVWSDVAAIADAREAWIAVLTAVLADPDHLLY
jgi:hypothetical protein